MRPTTGGNLAHARAAAKSAHVRISLPAGDIARTAPPHEVLDVIDPARAAAARTEMRGLPGYAPTPLVSLDGLADRLGVREVACKDESGRFGTGAFKALGGAYAVLSCVSDEIERADGARPSTAEILAGHPVAEAITTVTASAGNHGRSVAWGSELCGCACVIVLPEGTDPARAAAIESHGATVEWFPGVYDDAVDWVDRVAAERGWTVVSDTAYPGYEEIPRRVYEGYTLLADEVLETRRAESAPPPTHLFIQAGVGGLATGVCGHLWHELGADRPAFIAVEPLSADCFGRSIRAGVPTTVAGPFDTHMGGLASGVPSTLAWRVLGRCFDGAVAISDETSDRGAAALETGELGARILAGPSGSSGVGALLALARLPSARRLFALDDESRVLVLVTETRFGPAAPVVEPPAAAV
ncbi:MAG: diaminopropionate ammonia-lyase [Gemmatimonadota bacterium]|nr:diaminopropionate ammonia-lyase [Gemmatimonadota bacterium]